MTNRTELDQASNALFDMILSGKVNVDVPQSQIFALKMHKKPTSLSNQEKPKVRVCLFRNK